MTEKDSIRRDRRIATRRMQILSAAAIVFSEQGFHRATMKGIADTAQVAEGTIYNYFSNKYELLQTLIEKITEFEMEITEPTDEFDLRAFFTERLIQRVQLIKVNFKMFQAVLPEILATPELRQAYNQRLLQPVLQGLEYYLQKAVERKQIRDVNVSLVSRAIGSMIGGFYLMIIMGDPVAQNAWKNTDKLVKELIDLIFKGLE